MSVGSVKSLLERKRNDGKLIGEEIFGGAAYNYTFSFSSLTEIHFPAAIKSKIEALTGYSDKWGATNATIYFDL